MIFGTDGIRARVGQAPMDRTTIEKLSAVLFDWLPSKSRIVLGSDTRASGSQVNQWLLSSLDNTEVLDLGVVPTPVTAYETQAKGAHLGVMITASHNPAADNGLKFFDHRGLKISYDLAKTWSAQIQSHNPSPTRPAASTAQKPDSYQRFILDHFRPEDFSGLHLGFDFAHGAGTGLLPELYSQLQMKIRPIGNRPDGHNINRGVGALHPQALITLTQEEGLDAGFALDGDGDRLQVVAEGQAIPGDVVLYALYRLFRQEGLEIPAVVGTIMCGMGLEQTLAKEGVQLIRTPVGDQNVLAELVARNLLLGGEPSGHIIQGDLFPAGDGFLAALRLARAMSRQPELWRQAIAAVPMFPVYEKAYPVRHKPGLETVPGFNEWRNQLESKLHQRGRLIVRYSGTEPKLRLFLEADQLAPYREAIAAFEHLVEKELA